MKLLLQKYAMGWDWLAGSVCCDSLNRLYCTSERPAPHLSGMCSGWIVNSGVVYISYQFEPDWDPEDISEEDRAEPVQARLLMICLVVVVSYFFFSKAAQHGLALFFTCSWGQGLSGFEMYQTREVTRCSPLPVVFVGIKLPEF